MHKFEVGFKSLFLQLQLKRGRLGLFCLRSLNLSSIWIWYIVSALISLGISSLGIILLHQLCIYWMNPFGLWTLRPQESFSLHCTVCFRMNGQKTCKTRTPSWIQPDEELAQFLYTVIPLHVNYLYSPLSVISRFSESLLIISNANILLFRNSSIFQYPIVLTITVCTKLESCLNIYFYVLVVPFFPQWCIWYACKFNGIVIILSEIGILLNVACHPDIYARLVK